MRRLFLCLACVAVGAGVADYTTPPRAAKREAVEKAESARGADTATADGGVEPVLENDDSLRDQDLTRRFDIGVAHDVDAARRRLSPGYGPGYADELYQPAARQLASRSRERSLFDPEHVQLERLIKSQFRSRAGAR